MGMSEFLFENIEPILAECEAFARTIQPNKPERSRVPLLKTGTTVEAAAGGPRKVIRARRTISGKQPFVGCRRPNCLRVAAIGKLCTYNRDPEALTRGTGQWPMLRARLRNFREPT